VLDQAGFKAGFEQKVLKVQKREKGERAETGETHPSDKPRNVKNVTDVCADGQTMEIYRGLYRWLSNLSSDLP